ncbi:MAG TPA: hypothetical protein ENO11_01930, partial [Desulfobacteraceae bacterium]|nr:hypothetical protein [Desulfobacteraceae bacterium]
VNILVGMWLPNIILAAFTFVIFRRVEQEKPIISTWVQNRVIDFFEHYTGPVFRMIKQGGNRLLRWRPGRHDEDFSLYYPDSLEIHANSVERVYHYPNCDFYNCRDCTIRFKNARIAEEAGFAPCGYCHPDRG